MKDLARILLLLEGGFESIRVLVIGDVMLDRYVWGNVDRISPEAPVPVLRSIHTTRVPGGAGNVAMNLVGLGVRATQCGFWGSDPEQRELGDILTGAGVNVSGMVLSGHPTISKTRVVARHQQLLRMDVENAAPHPETEQRALLDRALQLAADSDAIILSDYAKGALSPELCRAVIGHARARHIPVLVDPKDKSFAKYSGATTICPNLSELSLATSVGAGSLEELVTAGKRVVKETGIDFLTVTMSEKGILVLHPDSSFHSPARAREVFDVSGAGDTVIATLTACLASGLDAESAVSLSNVAAGIVVGKTGTAPIARHELLAELSDSVSLKSSEKVLGKKELLVRVAEWRASGQRIVFTSGRFDGLRLEHIELLERCHDFGDRVVVGIESEGSLRHANASSRPVPEENERARMLAALASTDAVISFAETGSGEILRSVRPEVVVEGGDYTMVHFPGAQEVQSWGGRVETVHADPGASTTRVRSGTASHA